MAGENNYHASKKKSAKDQRQQEDREQADYNEFLQDIEEDPEMRANINLYKDEDVINELEAQLAGMSINESAANNKSPNDAALDKGSFQVGG